MSFDSTRVTLRRFCTRPLGQVAFLSALCVLQPALASAQLVIGEFRVRGHNGAKDEFIEIYNSSGASHTVASASGTGYGIAASDGVTRCSIPNGTVIPARGHWLCVNSVGYSLASYPAGNGTTATGDATYTSDIADNAGIALFNNNVGGGSYILANRLDAVGSTSEASPLYREGPGYLAVVPYDIDYSFTRRPPGGCTGSGVGGNCLTVALNQKMPGPVVSALQDTDDNAADFMFLDTNATSAGAGQRLGAPGPENLSSPVSADGLGLTGSPIDPSRAYNAPPNVIRAGGAWCQSPNPVVPPCVPAQNSFFGTLDLRQRFTNNTAANITRLRFRVVDITNFLSLPGVADLRPISSTNVVDKVIGTVRGTTLEQPPNQIFGTGFNGTLSVGAITAGSPLPPGGRIDVRFVLGVQQMGAARFCVAAETLPASSAQVFCFAGPTEGIEVERTVATFTNAGAIAVPGGMGTSGPAAPYPSTITVAGVTDPVARITVTLKQITHTFPGDIDVLLVGPTGARLVLMSDVIGGSDVIGRTYTFDDRAAALLQKSGTPPPSGSVKPTNYFTGDGFPAPAPAGSHPSAGPAGTDSLTSAFGGLNPNGTWSLYVVDDAGGDSGTIAAGWELNVISSCTAPLGAIAADFDGDCASDITVYRPSTGQWLVPGQPTVQFGAPGDYPVARDYDGDGHVDRAVFRPSTGEWFVQGLPTVQLGVPGDVAVPGDYNGDGAADRAVYRPATGQWFVHNQATVTFGVAGDIPVPGDYNADGTTDRAVYRPSSGTWFVENQGSIQLGAPGDVTVPGDYDGNGTTDRAVFRPLTGQWLVQGQATVQLGQPGDIPVPGDYNGDGTTERAVFRPSTNQWFIEGQAVVAWGIAGDVPALRPDAIGDVNGDGTQDVAGYLGDFDGNGTTDVAVFRPSTGQWFVSGQPTVQFGLAGEIPVPGDYDGDGTTDRAVYRPMNNTWFVQNQAPVQLGLPGDVVVPGDYDGNGTTDRAVFRPSTGEWLVQGQATVQWGQPGDVPVPGDYDGDGTTDRAVFRPSTSQWLVQGQPIVVLGLAGDVAVPGDYDGNGTDDRAVYRPATGEWLVDGQATVKWGLLGDIPVPGDFNGDGLMDRAVFRPATGTWFVQDQFTVVLGVPGDFPASRAYVPR